MVFKTCFSTQIPPQPKQRELLHCNTTKTRKKRLYFSITLYFLQMESQGIFLFAYNCFDYNFPLICLPRDHIHIVCARIARLASGMQPLRGGKLKLFIHVPFTHHWKLQVKILWPYVICLFLCNLFLETSIQLLSWLQKQLFYDNIQAFLDKEIKLMGCM